MRKINIILPAYNEELSIAQVIRDIHAALKTEDHEIIVVDDGSTDDTCRVAQENGARVIRHPYNIGNGAAVKTGIRGSDAETLVFMDADGQHAPTDIPSLLKLIPSYDMVVGARIGWRNAPAHRRCANLFYNAFASYLVGRNIPDLTSGFRAIKSDIAKKFVCLLPNTFSYPSTITMALFKAGYSIAYVPIEARKRLGTSKINLLSDGSRFILIIMKIATLFSPLRIFLPASLLFFALGAGHAIFKIIILHQRYTGFSILLIITSVLIFLMGLVSEQVAQLRFERSEDR
ncbi:MAG: glycosyltransferase family 2 protein [Candidatus Omnitrophota bacterium]